MAKFVMEIAAPAAILLYPILRKTHSSQHQPLLQILQRKFQTVRCPLQIILIQERAAAIDRLGQRIDSTFEIALLKLLTARSVILRPVNRHRYAMLDFIVNSFRGSGTVNIVPSVIPNQPLRIRLRKLREQRTQILTGTCLV